ncbi:MAG: hypothetical protein K0M70_00720 [Arenimonas sp.]|uniref:hypothetical protein n=1 Tax=Arenimonas sp. TaxID=1872635 RepID=UPI0025BB3751|nr:hypothetical protein [Arenimonas sp.]MBW8366371.1 hypothetical protein [Arenimonas sp.]
MTVLMREDLNDADIAWAAADASVGRVVNQLLHARQVLGMDHAQAASTSRQCEVIDPAELRARGAL